MKRSTQFNTTRTAVMKACCLLATCTLIAAGCGSKSKGGGGGGSDLPGFDFGDTDFPVTNTATEQEFFNKADKAKSMASGAQSPLDNFSSKSSPDKDPLGPEGFSRLSSSNLQAQSERTFAAFDSWLSKNSQPSTKPGASVSESGQQELSLDMDYGQGFQSLDNCSDAIKEIRGTYKQTLSALEQQFKMIEQLDSGEAEEAGFKRVKRDNAAIAYTFEGDSGQGMAKGSIEGAADASNIKILMNLQQQMNMENQSGSPDFPDGEMGFLSAAPQKSSQIVTMKMSVGSLANLTQESIKTRMKLAIVSSTDGPLIAMALNATVNAGKTPGLMQEIDLTTPGKDKKPQAFNMKIDAQVKSEEELVLTLKSSGIALDEASVPALDLSYTLKRQADGSCAVSAPSKK